MTLKDNLANLQQKAKERTVKTQNIEYDLETLVKKILKKLIKLDPEYQRRHRWDLPTSSRLIESLILNIPIPFIYLSQDIDVDEDVNSSEEDVSRYSVIDGQQRLTAIVNFIDNKFALEGLTVLDNLNGCYYKDLPPFLIRRLEERTIKCLRIDSTLDSQVKFDIFERLNTGSVKLEPQELRNAVSRGPFNDLIKELATNADFRTLIQINLENPGKNTKVQKMQDVELVLRFFALVDDNYMNLKKGFKAFLSDEMDKMNKLDENTLMKMKERFLGTMRIIKQYFGNSAFAKYRFEDSIPKKMSNFNAAVYDALSISVAMKVNISSPIITPSMVDSFKKLFENSDFFDSVSGSVADKEKIVKRVEFAKRVFEQ